MCSRGRSRSRALLAGAALLLGPSCAQVSDSNSSTGAASGAAGSPARAGSPPTAGSGGRGGTAGAAADPTAVALETSDCAERRVSDCQGIVSSYSSDNEVFDEAPELAQCSQFNSWDGCESLQFSFDAQGCAVIVAAHGPGAIEPLAELRQCLTAALQNARWPCLALGTLRYDESCFIR